MTVREYDAKEKERLYGISRQTPSVLSLAVILFVALSAQASAKTYVECTAELTTYYPQVDRVRHNAKFLFSFDADNGSKIKNPKIEGNDCSTIIKVKSDKEAIVIDCDLKLSTDKSYTIEINRITGAYSRSNVYYDRDKNIVFAREVTEGWCKKIKPKF